MDRPSKPSYYLGIAREASKRSTCLRKHWGAVIVKDDTIVSTGYNGAARGCTNCSDKGICWRAEHNIPRGTRYDLCAAVHAEANAIINASRDRTLGATLFLFGNDMEAGEMVHNPDCCQSCKRMIINAGISTVVFAEPRDSDADDPEIAHRYVTVSDWVASGAADPNPEGY